MFSPHQKKKKKKKNHMYSHALFILLFRIKFSHVYTFCTCHHVHTCHPRVNYTCHTSTCHLRIGFIFFFFHFTCTCIILFLNPNAKILVVLLMVMFNIKFKIALWGTFPTSDGFTYIYFIFKSFKMYKR